MMKQYFIHNLNKHSKSGLGVVMQNSLTLSKYLGHIMLAFDAENEDEAIRKLNEYEKGEFDAVRAKVVKD